jgi:hypothetical protein
MLRWSVEIDYKIKTARNYLAVFILYEKEIDLY